MDTGEALKSGAVWWRFLGDPALLASSASRVARAERYHGFPTGELCADEHLCGAMPSMGTELCVISGLKVRGDSANVYLNVSTYPVVPGLVNVSVSLAGSVVATSSGATFSELTVPIPSPSLWHPNTPTLYDLIITASEPSVPSNTDTVTSYTGLRTVSLVNDTAPPVPASGPRVGWDNSGGDMPGQPTVLSSPDYNLCWAACNNTPGVPPGATACPVGAAGGSRPCAGSRLPWRVGRRTVAVLQGA